MSYVQKDGADGNAAVVPLSPTTQNHTISELQPVTTYTVELYASTQVGPGPSRSADVQTAITPGFFFSLFLSFLLLVLVEMPLCDYYRSHYFSLQCFDAVGWTAGRASGP